MVDTWNLVNHRVQTGTPLAQNRSAAEFFQRRCPGIGRILIHQNGVLCFGNSVCIGKICGLTMFRGIQHTGNNHVNLSIIQRLHQPVKRNLYKHRLLAHSFRHPLRNLHIVTIAIETVMIFNRRIVLGGAVLFPVVGHIGKLAANAHCIILRFRGITAASSGKQ